MNTQFLSWLMLPLLVLSAGCPSGGGGDGGLEGGVPVAYVISSGSPPEVQAYTFSETTGALTVVGSPVALAAAPTAMTVSFNSTFAYVTLNL